MNSESNKQPSRLSVLNRRLFQEAEGFLELASLFDDKFELDREDKTGLAGRCLQALDRIEKPGRRLWRVLYLRGQAYRLTQQYDLAVQALLESLNLDSSNIHTCLALGWCYKRQGQLELAIDAMKKAIAINENSGIAHYNMACYLALMNQANESLSHLSKAIEVDETFRQLAIDEPDFNPIREDPGFRAKTVSV